MVLVSCGGSGTDGVSTAVRSRVLAPVCRHWLNGHQFDLELTLG